MSYYDAPPQPPTNRPGFRIPIRLILAAGVALFAIVGYFLNSSTNPVTGRTQHISLSPQEEVAIGLSSVPEMTRQFGGPTHDPAAAQLVAAVGAELAAALPTGAADPAYKFEYHLLADNKTVNAFALPGGQIFITEALFSRLETRGQLAGVLGHETGHVVARHSAEQIAKSKLVQGLVGAAGVAGSDRYGNSSAGQIAAFVGEFTLLKYSREHELEADALGLRFMHDAGYDPRAMVGVMQILETATGGAGATGPEFSATHPNPGHRIEDIQRHIQENWPKGLPDTLKK